MNFSLSITITLTCAGQLPCSGTATLTTGKVKLGSRKIAVGADFFFGQSPHERCDLCHPGDLGVRAHRERPQVQFSLRRPLPQRLR